MFEDDLLRVLKQEALVAHQSFKDFLSNLIRWALSQKKQKKTYRFEWNTVKGKSEPRVTIEDRDRLYDFLDSVEGKKVL